MFHLLPSRDLNRYFSRRGAAALGSSLVSKAGRTRAKAVPEAKVVKKKDSNYSGHTEIWVAGPEASCVCWPPMHVDTHDGGLNDGRSGAIMDNLQPI